MPKKKSFNAELSEALKKCDELQYLYDEIKEMPVTQEYTKEEELEQMRTEKECGFEHIEPLNFSYLEDGDFLKEAVKINGDLLEHAPTQLQCDRKRIFLAAKNGSETLHLYIDLPEKLRTDFDFMLKLVSVNGMFLRQWDFPLLRPFTEQEKKLIAAAVANNYKVCEYLRFAGNYAFRDDKDFVLFVLSIDGRALRYVDKKLRDDEDVILKAIEKTYRPFEFASHRLRNDRNFILRAMEVNPSCLAFAPADMRGDRELVTRLMKKNPYVFRYAKGETRQDVALALRAVKGAHNLYFDLGDMHYNWEFIEGLYEYVHSDEPTEEVKKEFLSYLKYNPFYTGIANRKDFEVRLSEALLSEKVVKNFTFKYKRSKRFKELVDEYIPEVALCFRQEQRGDWHIYNVMEHILHSVEEMNAITVGYSESERKLLAFTMFFHDLGKPEYHRTETVNGREIDRFTFHNVGSEKTTERVLGQLNIFNAEEKKRILALVREHDVFLKFSDEPTADWQVKLTPENLKKYIEELNNYGGGKRIFDELILVGIADNGAQNPAMTAEPLKFIAKIKDMASKL